MRIYKTAKHTGQAHRHSFATHPTADQQLEAAPAAPHSPISLMKACTMSWLLSLGCAGLMSGWCLQGRAAGGLLLSRHGFGGGARAWVMGLWLGGSSGVLAGPTGSSVRQVPGDPPAGTAAADTSAGMTAGAAFESWMGAAGGGSSKGWVAAASVGAGAAGGTTLGWAAAPDGVASGWVGGRAEGPLGMEFSPTKRACLLTFDTLLTPGLAWLPAVPISLPGDGCTGIAGGSEAGGDCPCKRAMLGQPLAGTEETAAPCSAGSPYAIGGTGGGGMGMPGQ